LAVSHGGVDEIDQQPDRDDPGSWRPKRPQRPTLIYPHRVVPDSCLASALPDLAQYR